MTFLGVDPGSSSGALAVVDEGGRAVATLALDSTDHDQVAFVAGHSPAFAVIERVSAMPRQGVSSTFKFGESSGACRMLLAACGVPYERVTPPKWQQAMGCRSRGDKGITKARAQALFPGVRVTHRIADALLIAEFCRRLRLGLL